VSAREVKSDRLILLEHGKPLVFGKNHEKVIRKRHLHMEVGPVDGHDPVAQVVVHDERAVDSTLAFMLGNMRWPDYPEAIGVFRAVEKPTYDGMLLEQIKEAQGGKGPGNLRDLIYAGERWKIN
jgi:2-oxoglutarate ferredoxin oxidoreductase subunit beta